MRVEGEVVEPEGYSSPSSQHRRQLTLNTDWLSASLAAIGLVLFPLLSLKSVWTLQRGKVMTLLHQPGPWDYAMEMAVPLGIVVVVLLAWTGLARRYRFLMGAFVAAVLLKLLLVWFALPEDVRFVLWATHSLLWVAIWFAWTVGIIFWLRSVVRYG